MKPENLSLVCDPMTYEPLQLMQDMVINPISGKSFPIQGGIAIFLDKAEEFAQCYEKTAWAGTFYGNRPRVIAAPIDLVLK